MENPDDQIRQHEDLISQLEKQKRILIMLGVRVLEGKGDNMFVRLIDKDEVFVKFIYSF